MTRTKRGIRTLLTAIFATIAMAYADTANFESSHVHPIALTPSLDRLLVVNTPDALLESYLVLPDGSLRYERAIPVGLEPVSLRVRSDSEAWVVNHLSDSISVVDVEAGGVTRTLQTDDEPNDIVFAAGRAFVSVATSDAVLVYELADLTAPPRRVELFGREPRSLATSPDGSKVYAVVLKSGNQTAIVGNHVIFPEWVGLAHQQDVLDAMGIGSSFCAGPAPAYPPLPPGIVRNPELVYPFDGVPKVGLIVKWSDARQAFVDETGQDWSGCLHFRLPDHDLFVIDAGGLGVSPVDHLGTNLFEVSVNPASGKIYVPNTEARNFVRFEHPEALAGHFVDNRLAIIDPDDGHSVTIVELNAHIDRKSDPEQNLAEREASIAQPGAMVWRADGSKAYMTALGSRRVFEVDGACTSPLCIVGETRSAPRSVETGHGPSGVALHEGKDRLYVLNRVSHSLAIVEASTLRKLEEIALHDPSDADTRLGRQFLYDAVDLSGHGDASCASCHVSGDTDGLTWDLGNPAGHFNRYDRPLDNVRHVAHVDNEPEPCVAPSANCSSFDGFDPQKGPMATQTLRAMLEPLHWRGDRATFRDFNGTFVNLHGGRDVSGPGEDPAGLSPAEMETFRSFALGIRMPPNPHRNVDDSLPCGPRATDPACEVQVAGMLLPGNPTEGKLLFENLPSTNFQTCTSCHNSEFGTAGGRLGGVEPEEPTSLDAAALFDGNFNASPHSDVKIAHLRNLYEKTGPAIQKPGEPDPPDAKAAVGYLHEGNMPSLYHYLSDEIFNLSAQDGASQVRDMAAYLFSFSTETKPAVGRQLTVPPGVPPTGSAEQESLLSTLVELGDLADESRHCEMTAATTLSGRAQRLHLRGGAWTPDSESEPALETAALREAATTPLTFTCVTLGAGLRLGGDRDEDRVLDADDCAPADPTTLRRASMVGGLTLSGGDTIALSWRAQAESAGTSVRYDVLSGALERLSAAFDDVQCLSEAQRETSWLDTTPTPGPGNGVYFLIRAKNPCGVGELGVGREILAVPSCP